MAREQQAVRGARGRTNTKDEAKAVKERRARRAKVARQMLEDAVEAAREDGVTLLARGRFAIRERRKV